MQLAGVSMLLTRSVVLEEVGFASPGMHSPPY